MKLNLIIFALIISFSAIQPSWSLLMYADPSNDIVEAVFKNVNDLVRAYDASDVTCYVQFKVYLDKDPKRAFAWRYLVHNNSLQLVDTVALTGNEQCDLQQAIAWAFSQKSSMYHGIILSGHGSGILEPHFNEQEKRWEYEPDESECHVCSKRNILHWEHRHHMRSMLLSDVAGTCLTNQMMIESMKYTSDMLGKKLDFLGLDMCMGACFEHAYQFAPYLNYLVGVQNCASADGFNFYALGQSMQKNCTPRLLACEIVQAFGNYYEALNPEFRYTLSALDLSQVQVVHQAIDAVVDFLLEHLIMQPTLQQDIMAARKRSFHACIAPMYTDIYQVLAEIVQEVGPQLCDDDAQQLQQLVVTVQQAIDQCVCTQVTGKNIAFIHGMNIYFPYNHLDSSYYTIPFAQDSRWLQFLKALVR